MQHLAHGNLEALTQASFIFILAIFLVLLNLIVIATFINFRGKQFRRHGVARPGLIKLVHFRPPRGHQHIFAVIGVRRLTLRSSHSSAIYLPRTPLK